MAQTIAFGRPRTRTTKTTRVSLDVEGLSTAELLRFHERHFGRLDAHSKQRIVDAAILRGWDRAWDMDGLAA